MGSLLMRVYMVYFLECNFLLIIPLVSLPNSVSSVFITQCFSQSASDYVSPSIIFCLRPHAILPKSQYFSSSSSFHLIPSCSPVSTTFTRIFFLPRLPSFSSPLPTPHPTTFNLTLVSFTFFTITLIISSRYPHSFSLTISFLP